MPSGRPELPGTHDLGAGPRSELSCQSVVDASGAPGLAEHLAATPPGGEHPLVKALAGVTERRLGALTLASTEPVEGNGEVVGAGA